MSPSRRTGNARGEWKRGGGRVRDAKPRTAPVARRRDEDIAPYRDGARAMRAATGHGNGGRTTGHGRRSARGGRGARGAAARSIMGKMTDLSAFAFVFDFLFVAKFADDFRFYLFFLDNLGYFPVYESSFPKFNSIRLI